MALILTLACLQLPEPRSIIQAFHHITGLPHRQEDVLPDYVVESPFSGDRGDAVIRCDEQVAHHVLAVLEFEHAIEDDV